MYLLIRIIIAFNNFLLTRQRLKRLYFLIFSSSCERTIFVSLVPRAKPLASQGHPHRHHLNVFHCHCRPGSVQVINQLLLESRLTL